MKNIPCKKLVGLFLMMSAFAASAQNMDMQNTPTKESLRSTPEQLEKRMAWFDNARFGMFIHWGVYSTLGSTWNGKKYKGYAEHIQRMAKIPISVYREKVAGAFNPTRYNPKEWVRLAKEAGMKYIVITSKHHDGFAMFDSKVSDYNVVKATPYKKDPLMQLKKECEKAGLKFGVYYSHAFDWGEENAPGNDWDYKNPGGDRLINGSKWWENDSQLHFMEKAHKYVSEKSIPQLLELINRFHPALIWFDTPHKLPESETVRIMAAVRKADPNIIINGRCVIGEGDYGNTSDRPFEFHPMKLKRWEGLPTTNESYAYNENDSSYKPVSYFVRLIAKASARNGNILMNIGPKGDGEISEPDVKILQGIAKWWKVNGEASIRGTHASPLEVQSWGESTQKGNVVYLHVFDWPTDGKLMVGGVNGVARKAYLLANKNRFLPVKNINGDLEIDVPRMCPDTIDAVIAMECKDCSEIVKRRLLSDAVSVNQLRAFDAQKTDSLDYGRESRGNYNIINWSRPEDHISWNVSNLKQSTWHLTINYAAPEKEAGGSYAVTVGNHRIVKEVKLGADVTDDLGSISLPAGDYKIVIEGEKFTGKELFRPRILNLQVVKP